EKIEESQLAAFLRPLDADAPVADAARLSALREKTLEIFSAQTKIGNQAANSSSETNGPAATPPADFETSPNPPTATASQSAHFLSLPNVAAKRSPLPPTSERKLSKLPLVWRGLAAVAALAAVVVFALVIADHNAARAEPHFDQILDQAQQAGTLQL